jgi:hypothetical protein
VNDCTPGCKFVVASLNPFRIHGEFQTLREASMFARTYNSVRECGEPRVFVDCTTATSVLRINKSNLNAVLDSLVNNGKGKGA